MNVLIIGGLSDKKFFSKTNSLIVCNDIERVYLFRAFGNIYLEKDKVKTAPFPSFIKNISKGIGRAIFDLWNLVYYSFLISLGKIDIIIGIYLYPHGFYASILAKISSKPHLLVLPGSDLKKLIETGIHLHHYKKANYFAVRGNDSKNKLVGLGIPAKKIFTLHNSFDLYNFSMKSEYLKSYDLIFIGRLQQVKRIDKLINIIKELKNYFPVIKCAIVGDGLEKEKLQEMVKGFDLTENIHFIPHTNYIQDLLAKSKIFILTSDSEGLPMSIIEAMSLGLPVVSSDINDIPDIVKHGYNGFLANPAKLDEFIEGCRKLLENDALRAKLGRNARNTIEKLYDSDFSEEAQGKLWIKYLTSAINEK